ncbi:MAG: hypothetical protein AAF799_27355 [Myxococcota bacterium]
MKIVKAILWSLLAVFVLGMGGAYFYFSNLPPVGDVVLLGPGEPVKLSIDGGPPIEISAKGRHEAELGVGSHTIEVLSPAKLERSFEITERKTTVVPVLSTQCYATLDVTLSHYDIGGGKRAPRLVRTASADDAFPLTAGHYTSMAEIPEKRTSGATVMVLRSASCEDIAKLSPEK